MRDADQRRHRAGVEGFGEVETGDESGCHSDEDIGAGGIPGGFSGGFPGGAFRAPLRNGGGFSRSPRCPPVRSGTRVCRVTAGSAMGHYRDGHPAEA
ncbi:hypothetical protein GCM10009660_37540 [Catellatospora bangladeshensis]